MDPTTLRHLLVRPQRMKVRRRRERAPRTDQEEEGAGGGAEAEAEEDDDDGSVDEAPLAVLASSPLAATVAELLRVTPSTGGAAGDVIEPVKGGEEGSRRNPIDDRHTR